MTSISTRTHQGNRWIRQPFFRYFMIILSLLQTIHALLCISPLAPSQLSSTAPFRPDHVKTLLPNHPIALGRIRSNSEKPTLLKGLINQNNVDGGFNYIGDDDQNNSGQNSIPAHEQLFSAQNVNTPSDNGTGVSSESPQTTGNISPLKVMIFVDGTWLYYSLYRRNEECSIAQKLGRDWDTHSTPDWSSLPGLSCKALLQDPKSKWSSTNGSSRPVEVSRVMVYSAMHRDTSQYSRRYNMFQEMIKAGFDVNMKESSGKKEKGVDIQLAVDMLYYATVPDAYDVALLLTGDSDFLPALIRCRQKGKRVGLVSMRNGSMSFELTPNLKDYDTIWLEDHLSQLIRKRTPEELKWYNECQEVLSFKNSVPANEKRQSSQIPTSTNTRQQSSQTSAVRNKRKQSSHISSYTLKKVVTSFITISGETYVSSRDVGRHLKKISFSGQPLLDEIKAVYGGLYQFLVLSDISVAFDSRKFEKAFWVSLDGDNNKLEEHPRDEEMLSAEETKFLKSYDQWLTFKVNNYDHTRNHPDPSLQQPSDDSNQLADSESLEGDSSSVDYNTLTVAELKEICREKGLKITAKKKIELVKRIEAHMKRDNVQEEHTTADEYFKSLVLEYLQASGGQANSRNLGRYLGANKGSKGHGTSALAELKEKHGSLMTFINRIPNFYVVKRPGDSQFDVHIEESKIEQNSR